MRIFKSLCFSELIWFCSFFGFFFISFSVNSLIYPAFLEWFPNIVPEYNFVTEREEYLALYITLILISGIVTVICAGYISVRFDNERMEHMITKTEGMYTLSEGAAIYYPRYFKDDVIISLILPLPLLLADLFLMPMLSFLPDGVISLLGNLFLPTRAFTDAMPAILAYTVMAVAFLLSRVLSGLRAIDAFRGIWLSDIDYVG